MYTKVTILGGVAIAALAASSASAQDANGAGETANDNVIIVTAQKRAEDVQDVPVSIVALSPAILETAGVTSGQDLTRIVPNLRIDRQSQSSATTIRVRGVGAAGNNAIDPSVAPFIDGVYLPRGGAILSSFLDVEAVEVLRGPQGTLFGRNATTGALVIRTTAPKFDDFSGEVLAEYGNFDALRFRGVINLPVSDSFAVRAAAQFDRHDGYYHNLFDGEDYGDRKAFTGRVSARWQPSDAIDWTVRADYSSLGGDGALPAEVSSHQGPAAFINAFGSVFGPFSPDVSDAFDGTFSQLMYADMDDTQWGISSNLDWDIGGDYTLRWIASYREWDNYQLDGDVIFTGLDLVNREGFFDTQSTSQEIQLISPDDGLFSGLMDFVAGVYYFNEDYALGETLNLGANFCGTLVPAAAPQAVKDACAASPKGDATVLLYDQNAESIALFLDTNWNLTDQLKLTLGARYTWDDKSSSFDQALNNPFAAALRGPETANLGFSDNRFTYRIVLSYSPTDDLMFFANYSTGYKSGGINSQGSAAALGNRRLFDSEKVEDIELGFKSTLANGAVQFNATAYRMEIEDFQDRSFRDASFIITNAGKLRQQGIEAETRAEITNNLTFNGAVAYLDSEFLDFTGASPLAGCAVLPVPGTASCPNPQDNTGKRAPYSPKWQLNAGLEYEQDLFSGLTGKAAVNWQYVGSHLAGGSELSEQTRQDGYSLLDARLSVTGAQDNWTLSLFAKNLTNERYAVAHFTQVLGAALGLVDTTTGDTVYRHYVSAPRTYGASLSFRF